MKLNPDVDLAAAVEDLRQILARDDWLVSKPVASYELSAGRGHRRITFFLPGIGRERLRARLRQIAREDEDRFDHVGVLIVSSAAELEAARDVNQADWYPRVFFAAQDQMRDWANGRLRIVGGSPADIAAFEADVVSNQPVGAERSHYILRFRAPQIREVWPAQFVMMDVTTERPLCAKRKVARSGGRTVGLDAPPLPVLKRPFGIQRAYYPHFPASFLKRLALPPTLAPVLHMVYPETFDMFYKVLADGVGTKLMTRLKRSDRIHMLGPLGAPYDARQLRVEGVREAHVIGGGVGMAPLILLVQALRYYAIQVKAFIGIGKLSLLRHKGDVDPSFDDNPDEAYVYLDDLIEAGVRSEDIYLSCDIEPPDRVVRRIPDGNFFHGLAPEHYRRFLEAHPPAGRVTAFSCGPDRMMEAMHRVARAHGVQLKLLMEKRMGCGFGVCLSCVVKIKDSDGEETYARVCTEGPVFDAEDIVWKQDDSKSKLENCGSAHR